MSSNVLDPVATPAEATGVAVADQPASSVVGTRLIPVPTRLPLAVRQQLLEAADREGTSPSALARRLIETALRATPVAAPQRAPEELKQHELRSCRLEVRLALDDSRRTDLYASRAGIKRGTALAELVHLGLEAAEEKEGIPASRADVLLGVLSTLETLVARIGPAVLGSLVLLAYSVSRSSQGKVSEDELLAQARVVGEDEWQRGLDDLRREAGEE